MGLISDLALGALFLSAILIGPDWAPVPLLLAVLGFLWHCPIFKPYFGWRLPRRHEWFR